MSEPKEDIEFLSQKELEDGELEDGELDEPEIINTIDNESELINTDIHDDSDVSVNDKSLKNKKHKHHKKGIHRKRHLNSDDKDDNKWKKCKSNDECDDDDDWSAGKTDPKDVINLDSSGSDKVEIPFSERNKDNTENTVKLTWGYDSEEEQTSSKNFNKAENKQSSFNESNKYKDKILSPVYEPICIEKDNSALEDVVEVSKWNYDSDEEKNTTNNISKNDNKSFDEPYNNNNTNNFRNSKRWDTNTKSDNGGWNNKSDFNNKNWQSNKSPTRTNDNVNKFESPMASDFVNSPTCDKSGWGVADTLQDNNDVSKTLESIPASPKAKWGYESPDENQDETKNWTSNNSPKKNDNWGSCNSPKNNSDSQKWGSSSNDNNQKWGSSSNDNNQKWGSSSNDNNQKWGSNDSPKRNDDSNQKWGSRDNDDSNQKWGSRDDDNNKRWGSRDNDDNNQRWGSRDGSRRNNFRRFGPRDGNRRNNNNNFRRWGSRDGSQRNNGNQRWGSSNNGSPQRNDDNQRWGSSNNGSPPRNNDENKRWGSNNNSPLRNNDNKKWGSSNNNSPERNNDKKWGSSNNSPERNENKFGASNESSKLEEVANKDSYDIPQKSSWGAYESDDEPITAPKNSANENKQDIEKNKWGSSMSPSQSQPIQNDKWEVESSPKASVTEAVSGASKWGDFDSDEESNKPAKENTNNNKTWKAFNSDEEKDTSYDNENKNENRNRGGYNNSNWNRNDFKNDRGNDWNDRNNDRNSDRNNDRNNDRNKRWNNRNDNEKRNVCKYFSMGSCRHGDRCTYLHESPNKPINIPINQEAKKKELCRFYEHQQCYKRSNCSYMHEEFPCKLFHAGSKMCPSGDSCKYSHAPLNQETKALLEKYLDEKVDERTDKNGSEWSSIIKKSVDDDVDDDNAPSLFEQPENFFPDTIRYRYPGSQDMMRFPRPWNSMMRFGEIPLQVPPQMDFIHRQRFLYDRFQYPVPSGRMFPRNFRGIVPPNIHEGFPNGVPFSLPPVRPGNPKLIPGNPSDLKENFNISDPYIDNLAQLVVGKDPATSPKRLVDMLDPNMQCEDIDDFSLEIETNSSKKNLASPVVIKSPEIPPGAYVPRNSMNVAQPNVRLGPGSGFGGEQAMLYGGYPSHPGESAMMDYINMSAIHYFHNHTETMGYDLPWKLVLLEVPIKIPYPLMVIETHDLPHKYTDPRLKGHPSVLNSSSTNEESVLHQNSYELNSISNYGSQLQSPNFVTTTSESSETLTPLNDFLPKSDEPESPMFPLGEDIFNFKSRIDTDEYGKKIGTDRSYLQDPRFKRKKIVNPASEPSEME